MDERTPGPEPERDPEAGPGPARRLEPAPEPKPGQEPAGESAEEPAEERSLPAIRASDSEREHTARFLQQSYSEGRLTMAEFDERVASAYAARSRSELEALTQDLPLPERRADNRPAADPRQHSRHPQPRQHDRAPARRVTGGTGPGTSIAVMGGVERTGSWTLPAQHTAVAVMGGVEIDLRNADLQAHETTIQAFAFWGGVEILVPDDVQLHVEGIGFMGAFSEASGHRDGDRRPLRQPAPDAPVLKITGLAIMGGVEVRRVPGTVEP